MLTVVLLKSNINATTHARSCIYLGWMDNNNNNSHDNVYGAVIMTKFIARVHPFHLMSLTCSHIFVTVKGKGKVFPYSLPSVGPGADPGVQAVSPQVT